MVAGWEGVGGLRVIREGIKVYKLPVIKTVTGM